ncbi:hypothetical protein [Nocardioides panzhihuensis]|uniref:Uncharacterized protein n=1 Tax=Nocardioides panzhihuensis TaxID=860243 RepID=A0A7Z0DKH8_9ACTN|nr:hypothetical protein [Nocardioides panzhihuensis]NYI76989.1 hypothetical protein [Nocardioides panzhihuensis]
MPTARARHTVTETDEVASALAAAAKRWPDDRDRPARLLLRLVRAGEEAIADDEAHKTAERRRTIRETSGVITDPDMTASLEELRDEWPA